MERYAVIDLGTNTFHLLVVTPDAQKGFKEVFRKQQFIKLAENGIQTIGPQPFQRALDAMVQFKETLDQMQVQQVRAFGTAGLRTASNGQEFIRQVQEKTGIEVKLISGLREAGLIHRGVMQAIPPLEQKGLIMDIGGGSVEFIIVDQHQVYWANSFPVGVALLHKYFHHSDPISKEDVDLLEAHLNKELQALITELSQHTIKHLIGASGTFDVIGSLLGNSTDSPNSSRLSVIKFYPFYEQLCLSTHAQRIASSKIPDKRADMIVVASILIDFILHKINPQDIIVSAYAMKEGMLSEMMS